MKQKTPDSEKVPVFDIAAIENMPEKSLMDIRTKKQAYNDLILSLDGQITMVHSDAESGSNSPDDDAQEKAQEDQNLSIIANSMDRARSEMVRLGDAEELALKKAA